MKLAEALSIRKDLQKRIDQLQVRLCRNAKIQEGDEPAEQPSELFKELNTCLNQLQNLILKINEANIRIVKDGKSLTEMLAEREVLLKRIGVLREVFTTASQSQDRYSRSEIKFVSTVDVKDLNKTIDGYSQQLRKLDIAIQQLNFSEEV